MWYASWRWINVFISTSILLNSSGINYSYFANGTMKLIQYRRFMCIELVSQKIFSRKTVWTPRKDEAVSLLSSAVRRVHTASSRLAAAQDNRRVAPAVATSALAWSRCGGRRWPGSALDLVIESISPRGDRHRALSGLRCRSARSLTLAHFACSTISPSSTFLETPQTHQN